MRRFPPRRTVRALVSTNADASRIGTLVHQRAVQLAHQRISTSAH